MLLYSHVLIDQKQNKQENKLGLRNETKETRMMK